MGPISIRLPSVDAVLRSVTGQDLTARFGRQATLKAVREELARLRAHSEAADADHVLTGAATALKDLFTPALRPVFNLTGTLLHTNLGRAPVPQGAAEAASQAMASATTLEFDLQSGRRGDRDDPIRNLLTEITGAESATAVNNNAAALLLALNTLALGKEVVVSRGELIEIGGSFRLPEIMARAGTRLREVGTTNRTHARDFAGAIGPDTAAIMRVHQANYAIAGFTAAVPRTELAAIAHSAGLPLIEDLGSGSLADLARWDLPHEPMPQEALADGVDLVTFSGDKLLGGPQAGLIVGSQALIAQLNANPLKRALRLDKARLAALEHVLHLYLDLERLAERLPALALLIRPPDAIREVATRLADRLGQLLPETAVRVASCRSQIGSGALPIDCLPSFAVTIECDGLGSLAYALRALPVPVIGRISENRLWLDCRTLPEQDLEQFVAQLAQLHWPQRR